MTLTPVLVGLVAIGLVLPLLVRLKLPGGVEADLSAASGVVGDQTAGSEGGLAAGIRGVVASSPVGMVARTVSVNRNR